MQAFQNFLNNLEELISKLKERLNLQYDLMLHYEDPQFHYAFCNLTDITELPDSPTLKIVSLKNVSLTLSSACALSSASSFNMEILPRTEETSRDPWPSTSEVPDFSVDIEYRQGNQIYMRDGMRMSVSQDMEHDILQKLAEEMYKFSAYLQDEHFTTIAEALTVKHPCLAEPGSTSGCYGWKNSLKFKMGHLCSRLHNCGMEDVLVNKRTQQNRDGKPPEKNLKESRRSETNFLPNIPQSQDASTFHSSRKLLENENRKRSPNAVRVNQLMSRPSH